MAVLQEAAASSVQLGDSEPGGWRRIGLALYGMVALGELAMGRWYGGEIPVGGVI